MYSWNYSDTIIAPSLLAADWGKVTSEVSRAIRCGADWMHLDVMDGHFVDNISFGPQMIEDIHASNDIFLDVHLMISRPDLYLDKFLAAGADMLTVHVESDHDVSRTLQRIKDAKCLAGLAFNPSTPFSSIEPFLKEINLLLPMTVVPGFGGQSFMKEVLPKIKAAATFRQNNNLCYHIEVDGGINESTSLLAKNAGANILVAGSSTFQAPDMKVAIEKLRHR